ncbi:MAG: hypothetical protein PF485_02115 [Bacteroidales bacterium]|nr:hypothetical protein [Bacteroidales bacterium]
MKKLMAMMLMMASVFFFSCSDDEPDKLSKEETKTEITQLSTDLADKIAEMTESDGMVTMEALNTMPDPFETTTKSDERYMVLENVQKYLLPYNYVKKDKEKSAFEDDPFIFDGHTGTYEWIDSLERWKIDPTTPTDKIIIIFPADTNNMDNNNATLTMHNYDDIEIEGELYPTDIDVDLYISDIKVVDIDLVVVWFESGEYIGEPTSLDVSVYLIPFEFTGNFVHTSTVADINFAILYDGAQFFSAGVGANWTNAGDSIPSNINGYVQFFEVKFQADIDVVKLIIVINDMENYSSEDEFLSAINNEIDAYVTVSGTWAADIELGLDVQDGLDILFVYADGTSESAIPYFEDLALELEDFFGELEDYYSEW